MERGKSKPGGAVSRGKTEEEKKNNKGRGMDSNSCTARANGRWRIAKWGGGKKKGRRRGRGL